MSAERSALRLLVALPLVAATTSVEVARVEGANIQRPQWAPGGTQLAWEANYHEQQLIDLFLGDPSTRQFQRVGQNPTSTSSITQAFRTASRAGHVVSDLSFSPAWLGHFVYTASNPQHDLELYVEGRGVLAASPGVDGGAAWSPDGRYIAFTSSRTGEGDVYIVQPEVPSAMPVRITRTETAAELYIDWSPDSHNMVYVTRGREGDHIWRVGIEGTSPVQLTSWAGSQILPRYSPTDRVVAFYANNERKDRFDLYLIADDPSAAPIRLVEDVIPNSTGPAWTPDGRSIVFTARDDDAYNPIGIVPIDYPLGRQTLPFDTVGHSDVAVTQTAAGVLRVAYVAQGRMTDRNLSFKRLYVAEVLP